LVIGFQDTVENVRDVFLGHSVVLNSPSLFVTTWPESCYLFYISRSIVG